MVQTWLNRLVARIAVPVIAVPVIAAGLAVFTPTGLEAQEVEPPAALEAPPAALEAPPAALEAPPATTPNELPAAEAAPPVSPDVAAVTADQVQIRPEDIRIEQSLEGGYVLHVRRTPSLGSIMLTESTEAPDRSVTTFAYRAPEPHPTYADERRVLDGVFLPQDGRYFLMDSTPEPDEEFGEAFRIFIPYIVEFGYPDTRNGEVMLLDGAYLSIRAFAAPFADYRGAFADNPFILRLEQRPMEGPPAGNFMPDTVEAFADIAEENDGEMLYSEGPDDTLNQIAALIPDEGDTLDLVLALDTTQSMRDDMPVLRDQLVELLQERTEGYRAWRVGFMLYRDYLEDYLVRKYDFVEQFELVQDRLNRIRVAGGRDIPEAVYEALWASVQGFEWVADDRMIILVGDAPPHPRPRGSVTREQVFDRARELDVRIHTIILPQ